LPRDVLSNDRSSPPSAAVETQDAASGHTAYRQAIVNDMAGGRSRMTGIAQWSDIDPTGTSGPVAELTQVLALLESAEGHALTISELRAHGIATPGQSVYELQLAGYPIERVHHRRGASGCTVLAYRLSGRRRHDHPQRPES
jgi:hypothetical protein